MTISFDRKLMIAQDTLINVIEGESVLLNLKSESYFGLDPVGTRMWTLLATSDSIQSAYETLLDEYDVDADKLRLDMQDLIEKLVLNGLMEVAAGQAA
ncbi:MAG TPA: PqqD family protein [Blastocatellia bacterium]|nr:PqqD family protein [Blastocatellia bacterium]